MAVAGTAGGNSLARKPGSPVGRRKPPRRGRISHSQAPLAGPDRPQLNLESSTIAIPLLEQIEEDERERKKSGELKEPKRPPTLFKVIIELNLDYSKGRDEAARHVRDLAKRYANTSVGERINEAKSKFSERYVYGHFHAATIRKFARPDKRTGGPSPIFRIWLDHAVGRFINQSISTVKADAAHNAFGAFGKGVVWAVIDSGVDRSHPHFVKHRNLDLAAPLVHRDFTADGESDATLERNACIDLAGHGTHVAGIIAGEFEANAKRKIEATIERRNTDGDKVTDTLKDIPHICGMAPECKILSLKVLDETGAGETSSIIAALEYVNHLNAGGSRMLVQGVNLSVGYDFEPEWYACGQSPLCVEVDRLVRSGVVVVVAAGNSGYGFNMIVSGEQSPAGLDLTINDPGNAELAITVGSTHRDQPHTYGVSYFSSKGPTGDGRQKPDIVAPGERIISCRSSGRPAARRRKVGGNALYKEDSGTSMAAPHVSGVIAAFLSIRPEFKGRAEAVKEIFLSSAIDLKRTVSFQGRGLVDVMRAIQSV